MKIKIILTILFSAIFVSGQNSLSEIQKQFEKIQSFSCNFSQSIKSNGTEKNIIKDGKFIFSKPDNYRIEFGTRVIVSDGIIYKNYDASGKRLIISRVEDDPLNFSLQKLIYEYPEQCEITESDKKIKLIPHDDELGLDFIIIHYDNVHFLTKIEMYDFNNNGYVFSLSKINKDDKIDNDIFEFVPPKEAKVIDLR